jgi:mRNA interferase RelE/StbE
MAYKVSIKKSAIKNLEKINEPHYSNIKKIIFKLADNPRPQGYKKLKNRDAFRIRVTNYRIIYEIFDDILLVDVINIGHRKDIYQ